MNLALIGACIALLALTQTNPVRIVIMWWIAVAFILMAVPADAHQVCDERSFVAQDPRIAGPYVGPDFAPPARSRRHECPPPPSTIEYAWPRLGLPADGKR